VRQIESPTQGVRFTNPVFIGRFGRRFLLKDGLTHFVWLDERYHILGDYQVGVTPTDWVLADDHHLVAIGGIQNPKWINGLFTVPLDVPWELTLNHLFNEDKAVPPIYLLGYPHIAIAGGNIYLLLMHIQPEILSIPRECWLGGKTTSLNFDDFRKTPVFSSNVSGYKIFEDTSHVAGMYGWKDSLYLLLKCKTLDRLPTHWFLAKLDTPSMKTLHVLSLPATAPHLTLAPGEEFWAIVEKDTVSGSGGNVSQQVSHLVLVPADQIESSSSPLASPGLNHPSCSDGASWSEGRLEWEYRPTLPLRK
jgi:hypothetical protein